MKYRIKIQGGLGNQLFQWAHGIYLESLGHDVFFDLSFYKKNNGDPLIPHRDFLLKYLLKEKIKENYETKAVQIDGYWQENHNLELTKGLIKSKLNLEMDVDLEFKDSCSIHVRRGDYEKLKHIYNSLKPDYYNRAIDLINPGGPVYIFSDDIKWCENNLNIKNSFYINQSSAIADFIAMSKCAHNIISNSTFSWWAAWLNSNDLKKVICPEKWFIHKSAGRLLNTNWLII